MRVMVRTSFASSARSPSSSVSNTVRAGATYQAPSFSSTTMRGAATPVPKLPKSPTGDTASGSPMQVFVVSSSGIAASGRGGGASGDDSTSSSSGMRVPTSSNEPVSSNDQWVTTVVQRPSKVMSIP